MELPFPHPIEMMDLLLKNTERTTYPNETSQQTFQQNWILYVRSNGLTDLALEYLYRGSKLQSARAFVSLWEQDDSPAGLVRQLVEFEDMDREGEDRLKYIAVQFGVLGGLLSAAAPAAQLKPLIRSLIALVRKPKGGYNRYAATRIREDLLPNIDLTASFPAYASLHLPETARSDFAQMLMQQTENTSSKRWDQHRLAARDKVRAWVSAPEPAPADAAVQQSETAAEPGGAAAAEVPDVPRAAQNLAAGLGSVIAALQALVPYAQSLEQSAVQHRGSREQEVAHGAPSGEAEKRIADLEQQLSEKTALIDLIEKDNAAVSGERAEHLEELLAVEYEDFRGAEELEMSETLGKNMRDQLRQVFKMLHAYGLKF